MEGEEKRDVSKEDLGIEEGEHDRKLSMPGTLSGNNTPFFLPSCADSEEEGDCDEGPLEEDIIIHADGDDAILEDSPADCCPDPCYLKFPILAGDDDSPFWQGWANLRLKTFQLIENKYFETAVITMILLSSLALVSQ